MRKEGYNWIYSTSRLEFGYPKVSLEVTFFTNSS